MRVTLTGASGLIGSRLVEALKARGDDVTVLSRDPGRARESLGVHAAAWDPEAALVNTYGMAAAVRRATTKSRCAG